uniref:Receptor expression-enhancing protein n=1 Tax=Strongyloides papillosus TaxID=174720 RepID=A0A0N5BIR4_STREA
MSSEVESNNTNNMATASISTTQPSVTKTPSTQVSATQPSAAKPSPNDNSTVSVSFNKLHGMMVKEMYKDQNKLLTLVFKKYEEATGQKRETLIYGTCGIIALYLCFGYAAQVLCNMIGYAYPCYKSIQAIKTEEKEDDTKWLMYWCVFGWFTCVDFFADNIFGWFPIYYLFKAVFLLYLALPWTNGSVLMYKRYVEPLSDKIEAYFEKKDN